MSSMKEKKKRREKKENALRQSRMENLINYTSKIRLPREFNELNILSRRYIRLTYNKYYPARAIRKRGEGEGREEGRREFFVFANGRKIRR